MAETVPLLEMRQVTKTFPGVRALHNVSLSVRRGEIHALTGENGAGKSTLMKILSGAYAADSGAILMQGRPVRISNPNDARDYGIKIIYQELSLAANMTVAENIFLGMELAQGGVLVNRARMNKETLKVLERLGASFGPTDVVGSLSIAEQQQVEIARAIIHDSKVLIMDEPTATLSEWETDRLFQIIRVLRDDGIAVIYISHRMAEIYELADRVSVLRDGEYIGTLERSELSAPRLIQMMVGRELKDFYKHERTTRAGDVVMEVTGMSDGDRVKDVSFTVRSGEVLGLAGLVGAGRTELARLVFGADPRTKGHVTLEGRPVTISRPTDAIRAGIGYLPENRKEQGLFLQMSALENIAINVMPQNSVAGVIRRRSIARIVAEAIRSLAIRLASPRSLALGLSGGNQQKLLVARWLAIRPKVLLLDEPTRGVDVGAKSEIYRIIGELVAQGVGVVFISSELPEVVGMCDRVLVMRQGQIVAELGTAGHEAITQENIVAYATGTKKAGP
jgi:ribose transport system ATP-binding protein